MIILVIVLVTGGGSNDRSVGSAARVPPAVLPPLVHTYANPAMSATGQIPRDWTAVRGQGFLRLANRDGSSVVVIASLNTPASAKAPLLRRALASIRQTYSTITTKHGNGTTRGGLPARSVVLYTRNKRGVPIRILVAAAQGQRLGYILEAYTAQRATLHDLVETQQIVTALRLAG